MSDPNESRPILDVDQALSITGGDADMLIAIVNVFADEGPAQLQAIRDGIDGENAVGIQRAAHQLKGSVVIFGAARAESAAIELEAIARAEDFDAIAPAWDKLKGELEQLMQALEKLPEQLTKGRDADSSQTPSDNGPSNGDSDLQAPAAEGPLQ